MNYAGILVLVWGIGYSSGCNLIDVNYRGHVVEAELTPPLVASPQRLIGREKGLGTR